VVCVRYAVLGLVDGAGVGDRDREAGGMSRAIMRELLVENTRLRAENEELRAERDRARDLAAGLIEQPEFCTCRRFRYTGDIVLARADCSIHGR
jgi:hypothetical protein